jgi:hypothetical protein
MRNLVIRRQATVDVSFTADQWELFDEKGRDDAALELNNALRDAIAAPGATATTVEAAMQVVQRRLAHLGADDSEPQHLIDRVLEMVFVD